MTKDKQTPTVPLSTAASVREKVFKKKSAKKPDKQEKAAPPAPGVSASRSKVEKPPMPPVEEASRWSPLVSLADVMTRGVLTIEQNWTVREAARLMSKRSVGSLVVTTRKGLAGIVTERDILTAVAEKRDPERTKVNQIMSSPVVVGSEDLDLQDSIRIMVQNNIKRLPILRGKKLVGIVTLTDFARFEPNVNEALQKALKTATLEVKKRFGKYSHEDGSPAVMYS